MRFGRLLAVIACAGLLSAGAIGLARPACAQDLEQVEAGSSRSSGGTGSADLDSADQASPEDRKPPMDIEGCWQAAEGGLIFEFHQNANGTKLKAPSSVGIVSDGHSGVFGGCKLKGSVSSTAFEFNGKGYFTDILTFPFHPKPNCTISGMGTGDGSQLTAMFKFREGCTRFFGRKPASLSLLPIPCE